MTQAASRTPASDPGTEADTFDPFAGGGIERVYNTSEAQREVWFADRLSKEASLAFNESNRLDLVGPLDLDALHRAACSLVERHDILRATFSPDGTEVIVGADATLSWKVDDHRRSSPAEAEAAVAAAAVAAVEHPFVLEAGPLFRITLHRLADDRHVLLMTAHHIVCDGWSWGVLIDEFGALYAEQLGVAPGPDNAPSYGDYVAWEAAEANGAAMEGHRAFWRSRFSGGALPVLQLPTDRRRPAVRSFRSARIDRHIDLALLAEVRKAGGQAGASLFAALYAGFAALLARLTDQDDLVIGVPAAGQSASGMTRLIGHCVNLLPVRTAVDGTTPFHTFVHDTSSLLLDAFDHQTLTYGSLLKELPLPRDPSRLPLVSVMFNVDPALHDIACAFPHLHATLATNARRFENFELFVNAVALPDGMRFECQYNADLFDGATIDRWLRLYERLLRSAVASPTTPLQRLVMVEDTDLAALQALQPVATVVGAAERMHTMLVRQAALTPDRTAVQHGAAHLTYGALDAQSNQLARGLRARGIGRGQRVGICLPRGIEMVTALVAVLKAGATYVPMDPSFPSQRLGFYADDAQLDVLLISDRQASGRWAWRPDAAGRMLWLDEPGAAWRNESTTPLTASAQDAGSLDAAYVIYTSGSTGTPKGVEVPHAAVVNFLQSMARAPGIAADDRLAAVTTLSFDIAVLELLLPLSVGAQVILVPRDAAMDAAVLGALLVDARATVMQATPGIWRMLVDAGWRPAPGFRALVGGESLPADLALALADRAETWNLYGPTETTVWSTVWHVTRSSVETHGVSIGRPIANTTVWVLDPSGQPCPVGVPGELCIGGDGVAIGYLGRPALTAERFLPDPWTPPRPDAVPPRMYRTGDRGRWRSDGVLEHLGRLDNQVKVRGYRIELGEIEAACQAIDGVSRCVVVAREDQPGDVRLVAYLSTSEDASRDWPATVRDALRERLPDYMLPQHVVTMDTWPTLPNGKLDRRSLPPPKGADLARKDVAQVMPRNATEAAVTAAMETVLNLPGLGVHDDFFRLGGHSLLAARLVSALNASLGIRLPLRCVFESPTPAKLAVAAGTLRDADGPMRPALRPLAGRREAPLTLSQERIRFVEELHPGRVVYNTPSGHRLTGPMDRTKFEAAFRSVVRRQPSLRTRIQPADNEAGFVQVVEADLVFEFGDHDLTGWPAAEREAEMLRRMQEIIDTPIDIFGDALFRVALYRLDDEEHGFLFMPHHIVFDGWSFDVFYDDMAAAYGALLTGRADPRPPLAATHGDYAQWLTDWLSSPDYGTQLRFWKDRFAQAPETLAIDTDHPRQSGMSGTGGAEWIQIGEALTHSLRALARDCDVTLNMLTMAIYTAMMARLSQGGAIAIGVPVRGRLMPELEPVMGYFGNLLPVALGVPDDVSLRQFAQHIKSELLDVFSNQEVPFERLGLEPDVARRAQGVGLYQALFSFQDARDRQRRWGNLQHKTILLFQKGATEDIGLWLMELPDKLEGGFIYNADLYLQATAQALRDRYLSLLERAVSTPGITLQALTAWSEMPFDRHLRHRRAPSAAVGGGTAETVVPTGVVGAADTAGPAAKPPGAAGLTPPETALATIWATLLQVDLSDIRASDSFFDLGGDSLLAMRAVDQAAKQLGVRVEPRRYLFENLSQLARTPSARAAEPTGAQTAAVPLGRFGRALAALKRRAGQ